MKKTKILILLVAVFMAISVVSLMGCGLFKEIKLSEVQANLKNAGYEVNVMTGEEYVQTEDADPFVTSGELETYLYAVKGNDLIHMFFYYTVDDASWDHDAMIYPGLLSGQSNRVVYFATKQARKDAKL